jgi:hypothetical protein
MAKSIDLTSIQGWQTIEAELPEDFEALAKANRVLETQYGGAKLTSARDLLRMILLHAGANMPLRQTVSLAAEGGGPEVSHVTLHKKMRLAAPFLRELVARLTRDGGDASAERWAGYEVVAVDASAFCGTRADSTDARVHLQLRLSDLEILDAVMEDRTVGESLKHFSWRAGQLALGDRGYANPPGIVSVVEQGADALVRVNRGALPMSTLNGKPLALLEWLRGLKGHAPREQRVLVYSREHERTVEGRLIAVRLPAAKAEKARARIRRELGGSVTTVDLEAAQYVAVFTTVTAQRMPTAMCLDLYRLRWQVELQFKRWKSLCHFDRLPNYRDDTILSWLYAKLLLALIMHRIASGSSAIFPPETQELRETVVFNTLDGRFHRLARSRRRSAAA